MKSRMDSMKGEYEKMMWELKLQTESWRLEKEKLEQWQTEYQVNAEITIRELTLQRDL